MKDRNYLGFVAVAHAVFCFSMAGLSGCSEDNAQSDDDNSREVEPSEGDDDSDTADGGKNGKADSGSKRDSGSAPLGDAGSGAQNDARTPLDASGSDEPSDGGTKRADGSSNDAGTSDASADAPDDLGEGDGKDVITIGDSWMLLMAGTGIEVGLEKASGHDYRNYSAPGTKLLDEVIPGQYTRAKQEDPDIKTVVMTAGGNDILQDLTLLPDCVDLGDGCKAQIQRVADRLKKLWEEMASDGVRDVVIIGYSRTTNPLGIGSQMKSVEYSAMLITPICAMVPAPLRCHSFDSDTVDGLAIGADGIHPTAAGDDAIGKAVWELMQQEGMRR